MSEDRVGEQLAASMVGSAISEPALSQLRLEFAWLSLPGGQTLFYEGEVGDSLYVVVTGALAVVVRNEEGGADIIARIRPGETIGEMALISGEPRSATVTAVRDSELLRLDKPVFEEMVERFPGAMMPLVWQLVRRLRQATHRETTPPPPRTIAVLPVAAGVAGAAMARGLVAALAAQGGKIELIDTAEELRPTEWFAALEARRDLVVYLADPAPTMWTRLSIRQADRVLLVAQAGIAEDPSVMALLTGPDAPRHPIDLVVLQPGSGPVHWEMSPAISELRPEMSCVLRHDHGHDLARLARLLTGRAIGLVLSGGGARGFAHIGVIRALREMNVPIDLVGGCSMGAIIAAGVAAEWDDRQLVANMRRAFVASSPVNDYSLPLLSLVRGRKVGARLREHFGEVDIAALWRPYFCVSSDLASGNLVVHRSGPLWQALRASVAIPGLLPPVIDGAAVLADGGVINNLPVDVMRGFRRGPVVGVDVASDRALTSFPHREDSLTLWSFLRSGRRIPPIVDILVRAGTVSSDATSQMLRKHVDLMFLPPLEKIEILDWQAFDRAIEIGYRHGIEMLQSEAGERLRQWA
jgi:NTE family protein